MRPRTLHNATSQNGLGLTGRSAIWRRGRTARPKQKSPLLRAGLVFLKVIYFFASGLASAAGASGAGVGTMVSTHSKIALCEASPLRWPSLMMRV